MSFENDFNYKSDFLGGSRFDEEEIREMSLESTIRDLNKLREIAFEILGKNHEQQRIIGEYYRKYSDSIQMPETRDFIRALLKL
jgi:hypothetical protein